eukprot:GHVR01121390.1.p1 GENE.GHVR01121390.1~~GHVR01121390.1.p1  ORF type:complete len:267 (+),score=21.94 GHVR01121390.1:341-1141(+)
MCIFVLRSCKIEDTRCSCDVYTEYIYIYDSVSSSKAAIPFKFKRSGDMSTDAIVMSWTAIGIDTTISPVKKDVTINIPSCHINQAKSRYVGPEWDRGMSALYVCIVEHILTGRWRSETRPEFDPLYPMLPMSGDSVLFGLPSQSTGSLFTSFIPGCEMFGCTFDNYEVKAVSLVRSNELTAVIPPSAYCAYKVLSSLSFIFTSIDTLKLVGEVSRILRLIKWVNLIPDGVVMTFRVMNNETNIMNVTRAGVKGIGEVEMDIRPTRL